MHESCANRLSNNLRLQEISILTFLFPILLQNKQKPITNSCRNNLRSKPILTLSKTEFKILRKKPGDEMFRVSNSRGADEIKDLPILIDFQVQKHGVVTPV